MSKKARPPKQPERFFPEHTDGLCDYDGSRVHPDVYAELPQDPRFAWVVIGFDYDGSDHLEAIYTSFEAAKEHMTGYSGHMIERHWLSEGKQSATARSLLYRVYAPPNYSEKDWVDCTKNRGEYKDTVLNTPVDVP